MNEEIKRLEELYSTLTDEISFYRQEYESRKAARDVVREQLSTAWLEYHDLSTETHYRITERYNEWYLKDTRQTSSYDVGELVHIVSADSDKMRMELVGDYGGLSLPVSELHLLDKVQS